MGNVGQAISFVWEQFGTVFDTMNAYPVMWIGCAVGIVAAMIKLTKKAVSVGGRRR